MCARLGNPNLGVLNPSLGTIDGGFRGKQAFENLHLAQGNISAKGPQAGALTVLVTYLQTLAHKPEEKRPWLGINAHNVSPLPPY